MIDLKSRRLKLALLGLLAAPLAACGNGDGNNDDNNKARQEQAEQAKPASEDAAKKTIKETTEAAGDTAQDWLASQTAYLDDYAAQDGVLKSPSGVLYTVLNEGDGASPEKGDIVTVHYEGKLTDGTVFDSSYSRGQPATFPSDRLIAGWVEILPMMSVGDKWEIVIPSGLAYGPRGAGGSIPPNSTLIFTLELLNVADKG